MKRGTLLVGVVGILLAGLVVGVHDSPFTHAARAWAGAICLAQADKPDHIGTQVAGFHATLACDRQIALIGIRVEAQRRQPGGAWNEITYRLDQDTTRSVSANAPAIGWDCRKDYRTFIVGTVQFEVTSGRSESYSDASAVLQGTC